MKLACPADFSEYEYVCLNAQYVMFKLVSLGKDPNKYIKVMQTQRHVLATI